jgi:hypothetical protein
MKWSYSAHVVMRRCQRQLAIGHIMASPSAKDPHRREAYALKQLQPLANWQGSLVHHVLASRFFSDNILAGRPVDAAVLTAAAQDLLRRQLDFSAARRYRETGMTKSAAGEAYCALLDHEQGREILPERIAAIHTHLARCFENLASQHELLALIRAGFDHRAELRLSFRFGDRHLPAVTATLDLVFLRGPGQLTVIDWKAGEGRTADHGRQLSVYALAVARCGLWSNLVPDSVELYEVNLFTNRIRQHSVTAERLDEAEDFVYRSLVEMDALVGGRTYEDLDLNEFEVADKPTTCQYCTVAPLCVRLLSETDRPEEAVAIQGRLW